ncbi:MAG: response regulator transcription factor [Erysipelotrichaceae bacterium]
MFQILIAEDDHHIRTLMIEVLQQAGYEPLAARDGEQAMALLDSHHIDLLICDLMMPQMDGFTLVEQIRSINQTLPILVVSAKDQFQDKQRLFSLGADDYMVKPIEVQEMLLRVVALLRRAKINSEHKINVGDFILNYDTLTIQNKEEILTLPKKEFYLLYKLLSYPNIIFTRNQLMDELWGMDSDADYRTVDVHIKRLRERFKDHHDFQIITIRGLGYKAVKQ